jgi:hypothetical protein
MGVTRRYAPPAKFFETSLLLIAIDERLTPVFSQTLLA